ncbi:MAG: enolase C-terminal domain-like protein [Chloroflexota bacterium]
MARIADVWAVIPRGTNEPQDWRTAMAQILVVVEADDGTRGFGVGGGGKAGIHVIDTVLREVVVGQDPRDVEAIWQQMYRATHHFGRKGLAVMALSGLDLAIWDLLGKLEDKPVYELLGGLRHERVPGYASLGATVGSAVEQGFQHVKLHLPGVKHDPQEIVDLVRAGRDAVGPDRALYLDAGARWDFETAAAVVQACEPYRIGWLEEPLLADDLEGHRRLGELALIPIAGGEHEYTRWGYQDLLASQALTVWQPDACWVGGMTTMREIFALGQANGIWVVPHRGSEVWGLHAILALADRPLAEGGRPWVTWVQGAPAISNGFISPPSGPGFGVTFDEGLLARP